MNIRPETPQDYAEIAMINARAFSNRPDEALIIAMHRHRKVFDPELSLVAEVDDQIVGHVLFSPQVIRLFGEDVQAINLAPAAVDPTFQRQGVGSTLIKAGHQIAMDKGYALSYLLGHPRYYARFGYQAYAYGTSSVTVPVDQLGSAQLLESRSPQPNDVHDLHALWQHEEGNVDFAVDPGDTFLDWVNINPAVQTRVYLDSGTVVGYTRLETHEPQKPRMFLARTPDYARGIAYTLAHHNPLMESVVLPLHPNSASASAFDTPHCEGWEAGMAMTLTDSPFDDYYAQVKAGERLIGRPIWPVAFDMENIVS